MSDEPYVSGYYVSPIDGHDHFTRQGREECALCSTADRLTLAEAYTKAYEDELTHIAFVLAGDETGTVDLGNIFDAIRAALEEGKNWKLVADAMEATRDQIRDERDELRDRLVGGEEQWAVFHRDGELHRGPWPETEAREWLEECEEMGISPTAFQLRRRTVGPWREEET